jgi:hypothetical protein
MMRATTQITSLDVQQEAGASPDRHRALEFTMDLYIATIRRDSENTAQIAYTFKATSDPALVSFAISGVLHLDGEPADIDGVITPLGKDPPTIWQRIYQETTRNLAMFASVINVPFPAPEVEVVAE